jgi:hypothetical protein
LAVKEILAGLISARELGEESDQPHELHIDATVVISSVAMDRVSRESKYLAAKLAMIRGAVEDKKIVLTKVPTALNTADIFTKALVGAALRRCRALVLGHPPAADEPGAAEPEAADPAGLVIRRGAAVRTLTTWAAAAMHRRHQAAAKASAGRPAAAGKPATAKPDGLVTPQGEAAGRSAAAGKPVTAKPDGLVTPRREAAGTLKTWAAATVLRRRRAAAQPADGPAAKTAPKGGKPSGSN